MSEFGDVPYDGRAESAIERFDRQAHAYRDHMAAVLDLAGRRLLDALEPRRDVRVVLDVGTGVGALLVALRSRFAGARSFGCDASLGMLGHADSPVFATDACRLGVTSDSIDVLVTAFMLLFLDEPVLALREANRVLRPGGVFGSVTWAMELQSAALDAWTESLEREGARAIASAPARDELVDSPRKLEDLLRDADFTSVRAWSEEFVVTLDADAIVGLKTGVGRQKARFDLLTSDAQQRCVTRARDAMSKLSPADFVARAELVFATGHSALSLST